MWSKRFLKAGLVSSALAALAILAAIWLVLGIPIHFQWKLGFFSQFLFPVVARGAVFSFGLTALIAYPLCWYRLVFRAKNYERKKILPLVCGSYVLSWLLIMAGYFPVILRDKLIVRGQFGYSVTDAVFSSLSASVTIAATGAALLFLVYALIALPVAALQRALLLRFFRNGKMPKRNPGTLSIFNNVAEGREAEFEEWFQHEHLAERIAVPGFLIGRRYEAISADRQFFNFYLTESADVLRSPDYLKRVNNPTPQTKKVMSEIFRDMIRTVCERTFAAGHISGTAAIAVRFNAAPDYKVLQAMIEHFLQDKAVACGEIWRATEKKPATSEEERLRGGDAHFEACLLIQTLRAEDAAKIAETLKLKFADASTGVYRLLCEVRPQA